MIKLTKSDLKLTMYDDRYIFNTRIDLSEYVKEEVNFDNVWFNVIRNVRDIVIRSWFVGFIKNAP